MAAAATDVIRASGIDLAEMVQALDEAGKGFVRLLRSLGPGVADRPVPAMKWTVAETAAHMLAIVRRGLTDRRRADSVQGLADLNDQTIAEISEREVRDLADLIEADMRTYVDLMRQTSREQIEGRVIQLHAGVRSDISTGLSYQLFDFLVHGLDIATATDRAWDIEPAHAALVLRTCLPAMGPWIRKDVLEGPERRAAFTFPGLETSLVARTGSGSYHIRPGGRADAGAEVDPVETLYAVAGRRVSDDPTVSSLAGWFRPI